MEANKLLIFNQQNVCDQIGFVNILQPLPIDVKNVKNNMEQSIRENVRTQHEKKLDEKERRFPFH